jgi:hypothetical protein
MSRNDAGRFSDAVTVAPPVEHPTAAAVEHATSVLDDTAAQSTLTAAQGTLTAGESTLASDRWASRPGSHAPVGLSQNAHSRSFNDPSDYLG